MRRSTLPPAPAPLRSQARLRKASKRLLRQARRNGLAAARRLRIKSRWKTPRRRTRTRGRGTPIERRPPTRICEGCRRVLGFEIVRSCRDDLLINTQLAVGCCGAVLAPRNRFNGIARVDDQTVETVRN